MHWQDEGIVLSARRYGEGGLLLQVFTLEHGRHGGLVRGGASRKARPTFQLGNRLQIAWRARLAEQLGSFSAELIQPNAALVMDDALRLTALRAACGLIDQGLPDHDPHPELYNRLCGLIDSLTTSGGGWSEDYVHFELALLGELGFGLDLSVCAVTGGSEDLIYVSPRTGRAVGRDAAGDYAARLLPLPAFLREAGAADPAAVLDGLRLTGFFLERHVFAALDRPVPHARVEFVDRLSRCRSIPSDDTTIPSDQ